MVWTHKRLLQMRQGRLQIIKSLILFTSIVSLLSYDNGFCSELTPQDTVKRYYEGDFDGARLSDQRSIDFLTDWGHEPGWDTIFITDRVSLHNVNYLSTDKASVEVRYRIIGIFLGNKFTALNFTELIDFILLKKDRQWKIVDSIFPPHVSPDATIKHFEKIINVESKTNIERIEGLKHVIQQIKTEEDFQRKQNKGEKH